MFAGRSPQAFIPPMPPDQTSSSESSPALRGGGLPDGRPGHPGGPGYAGFPGFNDYGEYPDVMKEDSHHMMMQRWANIRRPSNTSTATQGNPRGGGGGGGATPAAQAQVARQYYGAGAGGAAAPYGYAPAPPATPGPTYGYGFSPYPQPSPYQYQAQGGYPFNMYGGQGGMMPPQPFMTPFMTPMVVPGMLDPMAASAAAAAAAAAAPHAGGHGGSALSRPGAADIETAIGKWFPGPDYAPVLDPLCCGVVAPPTIELHPLLRPIPEARDTADPHLVFDVLFPPNTIHLSNERPTKSWSKGRNAPALFPRLKQIRILTKYTPWSILVTSENPSGITVFEVIQALHEHYRINASQVDDWERADDTAKKEILMAYKWNRSTEPGAPGGVMSDALLRGDFLMERTVFGGLKLATPELCYEKLDVKNMPATFELLLHTR